MISRQWILAISLGLLVGSVSAEELRTWTDSQGRTISATFVKEDKGRVALKQADGKEVLVPIASLSLADSSWLRLNGINTGRNELMEYLLLNDEIGTKINALYEKSRETKDSEKKKAIRQEIDDILAERDAFKGDAFEIFKSYLPVDTPPFSNHKQEFSLIGALTWQLRDEKNNQYGYVSLSYNVKDDWNKKLKNGGKNTEKMGIPFRASWFFFSDNTKLQLTFINAAAKKDGAKDAFLGKADIKGLYSLGNWK